MSPIGKRLLTVCDNNLVVDLDAIPEIDCWNRARWRLAAIHLGLRILGGS